MFNNKGEEIKLNPDPYGLHVSIILLKTETNLHLVREFFASCSKKGTSLTFVTREDWRMAHKLISIMVEANQVIDVNFPHNFPNKILCYKCSNAMFCCRFWQQ